MTHEWHDHNRELETTSVKILVCRTVISPGNIWIHMTVSVKADTKCNNFLQLSLLSGRQLYKFCPSVLTRTLFFFNCCGMPDKFFSWDIWHLNTVQEVIHTFPNKMQSEHKLITITSPVTCWGVIEAWDVPLTVSVFRAR